MKNSTYTRLAGFLLAIGFFISCSSSKFSVDNLLEENQYEQAIDKIDTEIAKNPSSELYFQKGSIYGKIANQTDVLQRTGLYENMVASFDSALVYNNPSSQLLEAQIDSIKQDYWTSEYKKGLSAYDNETKNTSTAIAHFDNAIQILPLKTEAYISLSIAHYNEDNIDDAVAILKQAETIDPSNSQIHESLGFLYLEKGDPKNSVQSYLKANQNPVKDKNIAYGLVNAYISQNLNTQAISFLEQLVSEYPSDPNLNNVLGTQLFNQANGLFDDLIVAYSDNDSTAAINLKVEVEGVSEQAENQLIEAYQKAPSNTEYIESLAVFYNNMAGNYFSLFDVIFEDDKNYIKQRALELTDFAIDYYTKLSTINTNNNEFSSKINSLQTLKTSWENK